ncbi:uncharacterized protein N7515_007764 [Penicillium bovifimosum]|uniref:Uncharacterized protein n=1 Tax=Penicillium bovifimosum TaxID=126998 RepID=A0A9W9KVP7_9EURO|nr:uncharacterized protein N7515_007764 [Penicillium bovifimosum]KAJ5123939.1 hypothetical protein N7515_007764 [Penicillium bovifimosum]
MSLRRFAPVTATQKPTSMQRDFHHISFAEQLIMQGNKSIEHIHINQNFMKPSQPPGRSAGYPKEQNKDSSTGVADMHQINASAPVTILLRHRNASRTSPNRYKCGKSQPYSVGNSKAV